MAEKIEPVALRKLAESSMFDMEEVCDALNSAADTIDALSAERDALREKLQAMHRRAQHAESALPEYDRIIAVPPDGDGVRFVNGNLGRVLLGSYCYKLREELERAEAEAAANRVNAERYEWLRANCGYSGSGPHTGAQVIVYYADAGDGRYGIAYTGPTRRVGIMDLDTAIDAARATTTEAGDGK